MKRLAAIVVAIPVVASVAAATPTKTAPVSLTTRGPVSGLAADGRRAALLMPGRGGRWQVVVWAPAWPRVFPIHTESDTDMGGSVALAGTRVAWDDETGGLTIETRISSATISRRRPVSLASGDGSDSTGEEVLAPVGDGKVLAFTDQYRCDEFGDQPDCPPGRQTGDVVAATVWRVAQRGRCPSGGESDFRPAGHCARVAKANGELTVLAVDGGRIAARTDHGIRLMTAGGRRLLDLPVAHVSAAALSGNRIALRMPGAFEIHDTGSGVLVQSIPAQAADRLEDFDHGILVTALRKTVTLRRLLDRRTATFELRGRAHAQLEPAGLFLGGGHRVTFTPMADVLGRLG